MPLKPAVSSSSIHSWSVSNAPTGNSAFAERAHQRRRLPRTMSQKALGASSPAMSGASGRSNLVMTAIPSSLPAAISLRASTAKARSSEAGRESLQL